MCHGPSNPYGVLMAEGNNSLLVQLLRICLHLLFCFNHCFVKFQFISDLSVVFFSFRLFLSIDVATCAVLTSLSFLLSSFGFICFFQLMLLHLFRGVCFSLERAIASRCSFKCINKSTSKNVDPMSKAIRKTSIQCPEKPENVIQVFVLHRFP